MRILQFNSAFGGGGVDSAMYELCLGLKELGETVFVAGGEQRPLTLRARAAGVETLEVPYRAPYRSVRPLARLIREKRIDVIHAHQGEDYWAAVLAALLSGRSPNVVITRHLMTPPSALSRALLLRCANVVAVSRAVRAVLSATLSGAGRRLHTVHPGIDTQRFTPGAGVDLRAQSGWSADAVVFGLFGRFVSLGTKGNLDFVRAAAALHAEVPQARFVLVGEMQPATSQIAGVIRQRGLSEVIRVLPFTDEVLPLLRAVDVLVHPPAGNEALGLIVAEALACEKPVVATRLDGIPETFVENQHGFLVPPKDVAALTAAMRALALDAGLRARMGKAGRAHVQAHFSRQRYAGDMRALYQGIL